MNIIILSGGSGKRLWPLSDGTRAKQFIKIFKNSDGIYTSMLENVVNKIKELLPEAKITIATSKEQVSIIKEQIGNDINLSIEPCRKDTFPAIVLATSYLYDVKKIDKNESVVICPVDSYVDDNYFEALRELNELTLKNEYNINLMGIEPTYPSAKYGYIIPKNKFNKKSEVKEFKEKPSEQEASKYIEQGALWNSGILAFKIEYLLNLAHKMIEFKDYYDLQQKFQNLENISFDYAVLEKEEKIQVMKFVGKWKDLGTWNTLVETIQEPIIGVGMQDSNCKNTNIINELEIPILCVGVENMVVVASEKGIIVTDKKQSSYIKKYVEKLEENK